MNQSVGKTLVIMGILIVATGILLLFIDRIPLLKYLGKLPGDISIKRDNFSFYFPLTTCILVSIVLSLVFYFFNRMK